MVDPLGRSMSVRGEISWPSAGTLAVRPRGNSVAAHGEFRASAVMSASYDGKTYYFCTESCHDRFTAQPGRYVNVPIAGAPYSAASQSQQGLKREAEELKNLGEKIQRVKNAVERQYGHQSDA